ncbi:MAG TPA: hypothetical protein VGG03_03870 [Thermoanaerobaculia bacterium]|jgi:hypothetical protein
MNPARVRSALALPIAVAWLFALVVSAFGQQASDPNFDVEVARPAYEKSHPRVLFDEAHFNFHTSRGTYKGFADLITSDGYRVTPNQQKFSSRSLKGYDVLVIANPLGAKALDDPQAARPAFTEPECEAVRSWVRQGGGLLLLTDHEPVASAAESLTRRFGIEVSKRVVSDPSHHLKDYYPSLVEYTRDNHLLADHPITEGRDATERVKTVLVFGGQSLKGPAESVAFLKLADTAFEMLASGEKVSAAGRAQGVALKFGKGRVVVTGDAGMLSAQLVTEDVTGKGDVETHPWGMNFPGIDNRQLTLNIMHWLSGALK